MDDPTQGQEPGGSALPKPLRAFASTDFSLYWLASVLSILSHFMLFILRGWLVLELTDSPFMVAAVAASGEIPSLVLSIPGGVLADRISRRAILIVGEAVNGVSLIALAILIGIGGITAWHVFALSVVSGSAFAIAIPARAAIVPNLVPREDIANGVALSSIMFSGGMLIGPAAAGLLLASTNMSVSFFAAAGASIASVLVFLPVHTNQVLRGGKQSIATAWRDTIEGIIYIRNHRVILGLIVVMLVVVIFGSPYQAVLPVFARDILDVGEVGLGILGSTGGVGAIVASLLVAAMNGPTAMRNYIVWGGLGLGATVAGFAVSPVFALSAALAFGAGFAFQLFLTANNAMIHMTVSDDVRGRVAAARSMIWGTAPLGIIVLGIMAERFGTPFGTAALGVATVVLCLVAILAFGGLRQPAEEEPDVVTEPTTPAAG